MSDPTRRLLLFDATRLAGRIDRATPTGIDRVDLAYLKALGDMPQFERRLLIGGWPGPQLLSHTAADALIALAQRRWQVAAPCEGAAFLKIRHWLQSPPNPRPAPRIRREARDSQPLARRIGNALSLPAGAFRLKTALAAHKVPALYVNTSHGRLFRALATRWMTSRDVAGVFFVHDLIPLEFPQYNRPAEPARHAARLAAIATRARLVITNSESTSAALLQWWQEQGVRPPRIQALPLGLAPGFGEDKGAELPQASTPYFAVLGTIEPRKNHALLLDIWEQLVRDRGQAAPRLLLIGRRGWENQAVFDRLDRTPALAAHVAECAGLSDAEVASLLRGARALLTPSFAEGYGLPVAEALALHTPVIASDLAAHREVGGDTAEYLAADDRAGWLRAIEDYSPISSMRRQDAWVRLSHYRAPTWQAHFSALGDLLHDLV